MKFLKKLVFVLLGILAVLFIVTFFLPKHAHVERTTTIDAPASIIFGEVNDLKKWKAWSPWLNIDPNMELNFGTNTVGKGGSYSWASENEKVGVGKMVITESVPNEVIKSKMNFEPNMDDDMFANLYFTEKDGKTTVKWDFDGDFKGSGKWFGLMMDKMLGPQYVEGLAALKAHTEKLAKEAPKTNFSTALLDYPSETFAGVRSVVSFDNMETAFGNGYGALMQAGVQPIGPASGIYYTYDFEKKESDMAPAFPVASGSSHAAPVSVFALPARKAAMLSFKGNYDQSYDMHMTLEKFMTDQGLKQSGAVIEKYLVGPNDTKNPDEYQTEIYYFYD